MLLARPKVALGNRAASRRLAAAPKLLSGAGARRPGLQQRAYQSQASNALQQQQQEHAAPEQNEEHHINPDEWDMNYWHYQPWWLQPPMIIATGVAFIVASLVLDNEELSKTAALAAGPVALYWGIFLFVLPRRFKTFAVDYIESHPEAEEAAREQQHQHVMELLQQQQEQQQQQEEQEGSNGSRQ